MPNAAIFVTFNVLHVNESELPECILVSLDNLYLVLLLLHPVAAGRHKVGLHTALGARPGNGQHFS